jgi:hypothetical protein
MQAINKRFYNSFTPALVKRVSLYTLGNVSMGVVVFPRQKYINILMPSTKPNSLCQWIEKNFELHADFPLNNEFLTYVNGKPCLDWPLWPKIVQVNQTDVHILGG